MPFPLVAFPDISLITLQNIPVLLSTNKGRMSTMILWQICHKNELNNGDLTRYIVKLLREQGITTKQAARDLNIPVERARNWYYKDTGMTALDLLRLIQEYKFVRQAVEN
ncbi:MAG: hypothetical protein M0023_00270 [Desulfobacteraceae bacterium]|nr:hypothetical protein [Desulfobacteraceae bacterium]